ncbi:acetoacetyl-CoA reductase [Aquabacterium sp. A7-Y]|uniref:acetoacetyl-CoA reductase n=1 Tax=Aquabacterium sp. A7-Y TaxID=1349605 RepID=UPI00223D8C16|nr:acetoacetyl-CoA reductase [Aquabacterium sp. A7-Y]MCW7541112.1 acetoacetyl-CoA reductase [Aquabacterium sp. A7-Y]
MTSTSLKLAVVTGGTGGLGEAICRRLADDGLSVIALHTPGNQRVQAWLKTQQDAGYRFATLGVDVADFSACEQGFATLRAHHGPVSVLVNCAGITRDASFRKMTFTDWQAVLRTNLDSVFNVTKQVIEDMVTLGWGRIINIASVNGQRGAHGQTNYAASKAGMHGFTKSLALELAGKNITVNTVSPGYLRTRMVAQVPAEVVQNRILPDIPLGRLGEPSEVAALVGHLASPQAAFITGADFSINGGQYRS